MSDQTPNPQTPNPQTPNRQGPGSRDQRAETPEDPVRDTQPVAGPTGDTVIDQEATLWGEGRHPVHVAHLVMGIAFAGLLLVWALLYTGTADGGDVRWLLPLPWLLAGAAGLVAAGRNARRRT